MTLIEISVVTLIIAVLAAIAMPSFGQQREKGQDADIQAQLRQIEHVGKSVWTSNDQELPNEAGLVSAIQASADDDQSLVAGSSFVAGQINVHRDGNDAFSLRGVSGSGREYVLNASYAGPDAGVQLGENAGVDVVNIIPNPSFETTINPWIPHPANPGPCVLTKTSAEAYVGSSSMQVACGGTNSWEGPRIPLANNPVLPNTQYILSAWIKYSNPSYFGRKIRLEYRCSATVAENYLPYSDPAVWVQLNDANWHRIVVPLTTPPTANYLKANLYSAYPDRVPVTFFVDGVSLTTGPTVYPYFDGTSVGGSWLGTPHQSQSKAPVG